MGKQDMRTPKWLFDRLNYDFGAFEIDAAATKKNALCDQCWTEADDGLRVAWLRRTFCNPPFKATGAWVAKAYLEYSTGRAPSVLIVPVGCSQKWFHDYVLAPFENDEDVSLLYPTHRISFDLPDGTPTTQADRDTIIIVYGGNNGPAIRPYNTRRPDALSR